MKAVVSLYVGLKTKIKVGFEFSEEFYAVDGVHQGSVLSPFLFALVVNAVTENEREGLMKEVSYANDLALMSETIEGMKKRFPKWRSALEIKGLIGVPAKKNLGGNEVLPQFCDVCSNHDFLVHYG